MSGTLSSRALAILGLLALAAWPLVFSSAYDLRVFGLAGVYAILVLGYQFIFGHAGALALTQGMFFGLAAYITAILGAKVGWPATVTLPLSILGPVLVAAFVAIPVLRLDTHYFALATLGIAQIALLIAIKWEDLTGGSNGLPGVPGLVLFGMAVPNGLPLVAVIWGAVAVCALLAWQIMRGLYGGAFQVMRTNLLIAGAIGIDSAKLRYAAFLLSAAYAGLAGALHAHMLRVVSPEVLEFNVMVACLSMAVVGGRTRVAGAILGALVLVHLPEWLRGFESYYLVVYGAVLLGMIIAAPEGVAGMLPVSVRKDLAGGDAARKGLHASAPSDGPVLALHGISKRFGGIQALRDVTFSVQPGEIVGLIGPNGSGKTTLLNVISGLYPADAGQIHFSGEAIGTCRPYELARRGLARSFQVASLVDELTAVDNVAAAFAGRVDRASPAATALTSRPLTVARAEALRLLEELGIAGHAWERAGTLPHGIRRRLEIARALALDPRLVLLDEPAAGLDTAEMHDLSARLRSLAQQGRALLIVEHNMPFLLPLAHRIVCLDRGSVIAEGIPEAIRLDPAVRAAYLGVDKLS
ncbi:MAG TPA: branched-chain amino acid ABC transporter ATP-binding protein/permease [Alphaproteobacteria bacterium]|nr:branched-chain amino acid ABC transporter ATP-binding protein/permease [Alphaproteobacteria bacterium]